VIRLQKVLADRGVASRRKAEELISAGRVRVDGGVVTTLGTQVSADARVEVDGRLLGPAPRHRYLMLNKPTGILSTARDERGRRTVLDLVDARERLYPVGRLDSDSEGLLLLTNDGDWAEHVLHPRYGHEREYEVTVDGDLDPDRMAQLRRGVRLEEGLARADRIEVRSRSPRGSLLRMVLHTGWKRQVRRMFAAVGLRVTRLVRVRIGDVTLGRLRVGEWRELTDVEVDALGDAAARVTRRAGSSRARVEGTPDRGGQLRRGPERGPRAAARPAPRSPARARA
jgi:23S rRNA pseudouridine2605 synthase